MKLENNMTTQSQLILVCEKLLGWKRCGEAWIRNSEGIKHKDLPPLTVDLMWEIIGKSNPEQFHRFCVIIGLKAMPNGWQDWRDTAALFNLTKEQLLNSAVEAIAEDEQPSR